MRPDFETGFVLGLMDGERRSGGNKPGGGGKVPLIVVGVLLAGILVYGVILNQLFMDIPFLLFVGAVAFLIIRRRIMRKGESDLSIFQTKEQRKAKAERQKRELEIIEGIR